MSISREVDISVKNGEAKVKDKLVIFAGDRGVQFLLAIKDSNYAVDGKLIPEGLEEAFASIRFVKPNSQKAFTVNNVPIINNKVVLTITSDLTDNLDECGDYRCQIHIFDKNKTSRITIPPITFTVKNLIARFDDSDGTSSEELSNAEAVLTSNSEILLCTKK